MSVAGEKNYSNCWSVPWIHGTDWAQMVQAAEETSQKLGPLQGEVQRSIDAIVVIYRELEEPLNTLCECSCPDCSDVCCTRATVWYDQRDISIYHQIFNTFPEGQITKDSNGVCCHLGESGCRLERLQRPFICTWYLCKAQTEIIRSGCEQSLISVQEKMETIKTHRKRIDSLYCQVQKDERIRGAGLP